MSVKVLFAEKNKESLHRVFEENPRLIAIFAARKRIVCKRKLRARNLFRMLEPVRTKAEGERQGKESGNRVLITAEGNQGTGT